MRHISRLLVLILALHAQPAIAGTLCASADFNADVPGASPAVGGVNQPSQTSFAFGTNIVVRSSALGITTQPAVVTVRFANFYASMTLNVPPVTSGVVRTEATMSVDRLCDGYCLQTAAPPTGAVVSRLVLASDGRILDVFGTPLGTHAPSQPFRVRMDIDMTAKTWSCAIDHGLNGFGDDPVVGNLPFANATNVIPSVVYFIASLQVFNDQSAGASVAYDDLAEYCPDRATPTRAASWGNLKALYR